MAITVILISTAYKALFQALSLKEMFKVSNVLKLYALSQVEQFETEKK